MSAQVEVARALGALGAFGAVRRTDRWSAPVTGLVHAMTVAPIAAFHPRGGPGETPGLCPGDEIPVEPRVPLLLAARRRCGEPLTVRGDGRQRRSLREVMPNLAKTLPRCHSTVRGLMNNWPPIS